MTPSMVYKVPWLWELSSAAWKSAFQNLELAASLVVDPLDHLMAILFCLLFARFFRIFRIVDCTIPNFCRILCVCFYNQWLILLNVSKLGLLCSPNLPMMILHFKSSSEEFVSEIVFIDFWASLPSSIISNMRSMNCFDLHINVRILVWYSMVRLPKFVLRGTQKPIVYVDML